METSAEQDARLDRLEAKVQGLKELALRLLSLETGRSIADLRAGLPSQRAKAGKVDG